MQRGRARHGRGSASGRSGGRGGGGGQRWWDPAWRAQRLAEIRDSRSDAQLYPAQMQAELQQLKDDASRTEIVLRENYGRAGADQIQNMGREMGLHARTFNTGRNTVLVVSKAPLPNYRADLDPRAQNEHQVGMSREMEQLVRGTLAEHVPSTPMDDDSQGPPGPPPGMGRVRKDVPVQPDMKDVKVHPQPANSKSRPGKPATKFMEARRRLPAFAKRHELVQAVHNHQVTVVSGATGCGKTTQLPQFLLEDAHDTGQACNIIVTQPRRISAISVAQRVADEREEALGNSVGYSIRAEAKRSHATRLLFCTTGVLLRRLIHDATLAGVTHVVVDEIHERGMSEDFLLIVLRDMLSQRPDLRLVLMSATLNAEAFSAYFGGCPVVHIPGFTHPVDTLFLEDVLQRTGLKVHAQQQQQRGAHRRRNDNTHKAEIEPAEYTLSPQQVQQYGQDVSKSVTAWASNTDKLDLDLIADLVTWICRNEGPGAVLVFVTGWDEIQKLNEVLGQRSSHLGPVKLLPLHSSMPTVNQRDIFTSPPAGTRKVVLATSIAETSITIDDVVFVIDCGKVKMQAYDALNKLAVLAPVWVSKASATQRAGRAGRVQPGTCFRLYPRRLHDEAFEDHAAPELLRVPLEGLCLQVKGLQLGAVQTFLAKAMNPPNTLAVSNAVDLLRNIGALDEHEQLTGLGQHISQLPADPCIAKLVLMGAVFGCLESVLVMAAAMSHRDPFVLPLDKKEAADAARLAFAQDCCSDHITILRAFQRWAEAEGQGQGWAFCRHNFLSRQTLVTVDSIRQQLGELVVSAGFLGPGARAQGQNGWSRGDEDLLRAVLCAGMFPSVASIRQAKRASFKTVEDGKVEAHPTSVLARQTFFPHRWLVYSDKMKTASIYLRAATMVSDCMLLLFGGPLAQGIAPGKLTTLSGQLTFTAAPAVAQLILELRARLDAVFVARLQAPEGSQAGLAGDESAQRLVETVIQLLRQEDPAHTDSDQRRNNNHDDSNEKRRGRGGQGHRGLVYMGAKLPLLGGTQEGFLKMRRLSGGPASLHDEQPSDLL
ncbi:hypothetical protein WJX73_007283 [Symbiochloris irregularis]|uniref:Uncharacterized protein n=1 Tax=Symbiochloris irregularis TaxID=706552 RepID=A0AAW1NPR6_9CHLO